MVMIREMPHFVVEICGSVITDLHGHLTKDN